MIAIYSADNLLHDPETYLIRGLPLPARESPERARQLLLALEDGGHEVAAPRPWDPAGFGSVHDAGYLDFLATAHARWQDMPEPRGRGAQAQAYAGRHAHRRPASFEGRLGYYLSGGSVPLLPRTWDAVVSSARCALEAAERVATGARASYALCRPPGHHAYADNAGGYCYLNNAALAAEHLRAAFGRVAVLDVDVHHGNGTQGIFYDRADVLFVSIHADPNEAYPWYAGYAEETGEGAGEGANLNLPLPVGADDAAFLDALARARTAIRDFAADALVVSLGFDAFEEDSSRLMRVTTPGFAAVGTAIAGLGLPTVLVQEGGYAVDALRRNLASFLTGFLSSR